MEAITLTGTHFFLNWLFDTDHRLYLIFRSSIRIETYDNGRTCVLHMISGKPPYTVADESALQQRWFEYARLVKYTINKYSLLDVSAWSLTKIFDTYSGQLAKFTLSDGSSFFGRCQTLHYSHSPYDPLPPSRVTHMTLLKLPNFYMDKDPSSPAAETVAIADGKIKNVIPVVVNPVNV